MTMSYVHNFSSFNFYTGAFICADPIFHCFFVIIFIIASEAYMIILCNFVNHRVD